MRLPFCTFLSPFKTYIVRVCLFVAPPKTPTESASNFGFAAMSTVESESALMGELAEFANTRQEAQSLVDEGDEDVRSILAETEQQMHEVARRLAALKGLSAAAVSRPADGPPTCIAPVVELQWEDGTWYSAWVTSVLCDFGALRPVATCFVLGYQLEVANVTLDRLRPWKASGSSSAVPTAAPVGPSAGAAAIATRGLTAGSKCYFVHPKTGNWCPGSVDRCTMRDTAWILAAPQAEAPESKFPDTTVEAPFTHIRAGRIYKALKRPADKMSDEERQQLEKEQRRKKRDRDHAVKANRESHLDNAAESWQNFAAVMGSVATPAVVGAATVSGTSAAASMSWLTGGGGGRPQPPRRD